MNIGILVYDISLTGGAENVALNLAQEFSNQHDVYLISMFSEKGRRDSSGLEYELFYMRDKTVSIPTHFLSLKATLHNTIADYSIDVLLAITAGVVTVALHAAKGTGAKVVYCEHSNLENKTYGKKHELRQMIGARRSDIVVTLTERDRENFIKEFDLPSSKVVAIPNWFVSDQVANSEYDVSSRSIVSVGRLEKVKGYDYLIQVACLLRDMCTDWTWDIYGDGTERERIQDLIESNNLDEYVTLKGNVPNISALLPQYAMFVMTSLFEGLPMSLLEAQAAGLPIVSFDIATGPAEIVSSGENGSLIAPYDTEAMACEINRIMGNDLLRAGYASKARCHLDKYSKDAVMIKWSSLLNGLGAQY